MADTSSAVSSNGDSPVTMPRLLPARAAYTNQAEIEREIAAGLPNQIGRMRDAYDCHRYYKGRFEEYPTRHKDMRYRSPATRRTSLIMNRIVNILTMHLYKSQPTRKLRDPAISQWLETVYRRNRMWAKFRRADVLSLVGGFAAYQFAGSTDPTAPLKIQLWGADQIAFWVDGEDPTQVQAVATVDFCDNTRKLTLWTKDQICTYQSAKGEIHPAFGSTTFRPTDFDGRPARRANPYRDRDGQGIIPFSFMHWEYPASDFETNSPGLNLKELNEHVNERLDNLGDSIYFNCKPIGVAEGVEDGWTPPAELRPGDFLALAADADALGNGVRPTLSYLMPDLAYVSKDWEDLEGYLDHTLETYGVPPSLIRMVQSGARSGAAIVTEQLPILGWVEGRRADWASYEEDHAEKALEVAAAHLVNNQLYEDALQLYQTLDNWSFSLRWPALYIQLPGPQRDQADDWRLNHSQVSLVGIKQEREDLTEDEAWAAIAKTAQENAKLAALGVNPNPANPFASTMSPAMGQVESVQRQLQANEGEEQLPELEDPSQAQGEEMPHINEAPVDQEDIDVGGGG